MIRFIFLIFQNFQRIYFMSLLLLFRFLSMLKVRQLEIVQCQFSCGDDVAPYQPQPEPPVFSLGPAENRRFDFFAQSVSRKMRHKIFLEMINFWQENITNSVKKDAFLSLDLSDFCIFVGQLAFLLFDCSVWSLSLLGSVFRSYQRADLPTSLQQRPSCAHDTRTDSRLW